jgi:hypothetical protein
MQEAGQSDSLRGRRSNPWGACREQMAVMYSVRNTNHDGASILVGLFQKKVDGILLE